jgi:single-stranded-DNA-specific exonuclease
MKKFVVRQSIPPEIEENFRAFDPLVRQLLFVRGISDMEEAQKFLNPNYDTHLHDPYLLKDMDKAVKRILGAVEGNEKIAIYSDYDADGIPGAVILSDFFKKIGYENFINYIPLRNEEGFGLNHDAVDSLAGEGVNLLITVDCGISDVEQVETAEKHSIDVIITDHHIPGKKLPKAFAIINPKQKGCKYPEKMLCGAGVAFKLVQALLLKIENSKLKIASISPKGWEKWMLDMVGLATLSDMVPLLGENRILAYYGMKVLQKSPRVGLVRLFNILNIDKSTASEDDIVFMITPRINAASRMGIPLDAFKLLSTTDEVEAGMLAEHLNKKNDERKGLVANMVKEIKKKISERYSDEAKPSDGSVARSAEGGYREMHNVIVMGNPEWKPSLLGLVANSFSDEHNRPVFLWGREGSNGSAIIKGSCRSGGGIDIVKLMEKAKDVFLEYGGHKGAGGFSVMQDNIHTLEEKLNEAFLDLNHKNEEVEEILVDKKLSLSDVNWNTYSAVEKFGPFGFENPKPTFLFENIKIEGLKLFGKEKNHLELKFSAQGGPASGGKGVTAMAFFMTPDKFEVPVEEGSSINLVATLEKSNFRNFPELRLRIVDIF